MMLDEPQHRPKGTRRPSPRPPRAAGDHDLIPLEHTLEIYHHLPNSQLVIFPNATHMVPFDDPAAFNAAVERFFRTPS